MDNKDLNNQIELASSVPPPNDNTDDQVNFEEQMPVKLNKKKWLWLSVFCLLAFGIGICVYYFFDNTNLIKKHSQIKEPDSIEELVTVLNNSDLKLEIKDSGEREKSRDAKRIADVKQMQTAFEMYFNDNNGYPVTNEAVAIGEGNFAKLCMNGFFASNDKKCQSAIINQFPISPEPNGSKYIYVSSDKNSYELTFSLEYGVGEYKAGKLIASQTGIKQIETFSPQKTETIYQFKSPFEIKEAQESEFKNNKVVRLYSNEYYYSNDSGQTWVKGDNEKNFTSNYAVLYVIENTTGAQCQITATAGVEKMKVMESSGTLETSYYKTIRGRKIFQSGGYSMLRALYWCNSNKSLLIIAPVYQDINEAEKRVTQYLDFFLTKDEKNDFEQEDISEKIKNKEPQTIEDLSMLLDSNLKIEIKTSEPFEDSQINAAKSRDSQRLSDIKQIQSVLEAYYNDNKGYPVVSQPVILGEGNYKYLCGNGFSSSADRCGLMSANPEPNGNKYIYSCSDKEHYEIKFALEYGAIGLEAGEMLASQAGIIQVNTKTIKPVKNIEKIYQFKAPFELVKQEEKWTKDPVAALVSKEYFYSTDGGDNWLKGIDVLKIPLFRFFENKSGSRCRVNNQMMELIAWGSGAAKYYKKLEGKSIFIDTNDSDFSGLFWCNDNRTMLIMAPIYQNDVANAENRAIQYINITK